MYVQNNRQLVAVASKSKYILNVMYHDCMSVLFLCSLAFYTILLCACYFCTALYVRNNHKHRNKNQHPHHHYNKHAVQTEKTPTHAQVHLITCFNFCMHNIQFNLYLAQIMSIKLFLVTKHKQKYRYCIKHIILA